MDPEDITRRFLDRLHRLREEKEIPGGLRGFWSAVGARLEPPVKGESVRRYFVDVEKGPKLPNLAYMCAVLETLGCSYDEFFHGESAKPWRSRKELADALASLGPEHDVYIQLEDQLFLEREAEEEVGNHVRFLERILAGEDPPRLTLLLPLPMGELYREWSHGEYVQKMLRELHGSRPNLARRIRHLLYDARTPGVGLVGGGRVVVARDQDLEVHQEMMHDGPDIGPSRRSAVWVASKDELARRSWTQLREAIVSVECPRPWCRRMETIDRRQYLDWMKVLFDRGDDAVLREVFRPDTESKLGQKKAIERLVSRLQDASKRGWSDLRVLEIGPGDFFRSHELVYRSLLERDPDRPIRVLGVDPAPRPIRLRVDGLHLRVVEETVEDFEAFGERFDLVVASHSLYRSDPEVLTKLLAVLRPGGSLLIAHTSAEGSFMRRTAMEIDTWIAPRNTPDERTDLEVELAALDLEFPGGHRKASPKRVYAEEIEDWLDDHRVEYERVDLRSEVEFEKNFLLEGGFDFGPSGVHLIKYFLEGHWYDAWRRDKKSGNADRLLEYFRHLSDQETVEHTETLLIVERLAASKSWLAGGPREVVLHPKRAPAKGRAAEPAAGGDREERRRGKNKPV